MAQGSFGPLGNPRYTEYAESIRDTARHAIGVVQGLVDPDGLDQPVPEQTFTELDLNEIAAVAVRSIEPMACQAQLAVELGLAAGLPRVIADRIAVHRILLNLLANAVEHTAGGTRIAVRTGVDPCGETWLEVEDDGPGFGQSAGARGVDADTPSSTPTAGVRKGLGLRLATALARANGGRLEASRAGSKGARVRLTFCPSRVLPV
jgi:signal transduction histidine kinase